MRLWWYCFLLNKQSTLHYSWLLASYTFQNFLFSLYVYFLHGSLHLTNSGLNKHQQKQRFILNAAVLGRLVSALCYLTLVWHTLLPQTHLLWDLSGTVLDILFSCCQAHVETETLPNCWCLKVVRVDSANQWYKWFGDQISQMFETAACPHHNDWSSFRIVLSQSI